MQFSEHTQPNERAASMLQYFLNAGVQMNKKKAEANQPKEAQKQTLPAIIHV